MTNLLIGISGSAGVLSIPGYLGLISQHYENVKLIVTHSATEFIPLSTFSLIIPDCYSSEFPITPNSPSHIELSRWADLFIILPASANLISSAAGALAYSLLTTTILSYEKEILFFPNMNSRLWKNSLFQRNVSLLKEYGHHVIEPECKMAFETASRKMEMNHVLPTPHDVIETLKSHEKNLVL